MVEVDIQKFKSQLWKCKTVEEVNRLWTAEEDPTMTGRSLLHSVAALGYIKHTQLIVEKANELQEVESILNCRASDEN